MVGGKRLQWVILGLLFLLATIYISPFNQQQAKVEGNVFIAYKEHKEIDFLKVMLKINVKIAFLKYFFCSFCKLFVTEICVGHETRVQYVQEVLIHCI